VTSLRFLLIAIRISCACSQVRQARLTSIRSLSDVCLPSEFLNRIARGLQNRCHLGWCVNSRDCGDLCQTLFGKLPSSIAKIVNNKPNAAKILEFIKQVLSYNLLQIYLTIHNVLWGKARFQLEVQEMCLKVSRLCKLCESRMMSSIELARRARI
jgi:hypothetical protein